MNRTGLLARLTVLERTVADGGQGDGDDVPVEVLLTTLDRTRRELLAGGFLQDGPEGLAVGELDGASYHTRSVAWLFVALDSLDGGMIA